MSFTSAKPACFCIGITLSVSMGAGYALESATDTLVGRTVLDVKRTIVTSPPVTLEDRARVAHEHLIADYGLSSGMLL